MQDCFKLLHFHLGSQITNIRHIKGALNEAARVYVELASQRRGLEYLDVGGGLGVDYDGSQTNFESSVNYTLQEYANDVVYHIQTCLRRSRRAASDDHFRKRPGRGGLSQCAGVRRAGRFRAGRERHSAANCAGDAEQPLIDLMETYQNLAVRNMLESYHDAQQSLDMAMTLFTSGYLPLDQRSMAENLYWAICHKIQRARAAIGVRAGGTCKGSIRLLSDTYFCNFSLFQSMPDSWAIKQLFPVDADPSAATSGPRGMRCWAISPATRTAKSTSSSTAAM